MLASDAFSTQKEKVLIAKNDNYLLEHDINEILEANSSLDNNLDRFRFVFFIGYESPHLNCEHKNLHENYEDKLILEAKIKFKSLIENLISIDDFYKDIHVEVFMYPIPSLSSLISEIKAQVASQWQTI